MNSKVERYSFQTENLYKEASSIFPELTSISVAKQEVFYKNDSTKLFLLRFYESEKPLNKEKEETLRKWLKAKLKVDTIGIFRR